MADTPKLELAGWTHAEVVAQGRTAYNAYSSALDAAYAAYFRAHPDEAGLHPRQAADLAKALPPGFAHLAQQLPTAALHQHHLSGRSSQLIALALLGAGAASDPSLQWLYHAWGPMPSTDVPHVCQFERTLSPELLNEQPRQTAIDFYVETSDIVVAVECKFGEDGIGRCSCGAPAPAIADCAERVLKRDAYWEAARELFFLPEREPGKPCPISLGYQVVRNVAAVRALATAGRRAVFGLIYDARNPYFSGVGQWPGWPKVLAATLQYQDEVLFRSASWQELVASLALADVREWAVEKHGISSASG